MYTYALSINSDSELCIWPVDSQPAFLYLMLLLVLRSGAVCRFHLFPLFWITFMKYYTILNDSLMSYFMFRATNGRTTSLTDKSRPLDIRIHPPTVYSASLYNADDFSVKLLHDCSSCERIITFIFDS